MTHTCLYTSSHCWSQIFSNVSVLWLILNGSLGVVWFWVWLAAFKVCIRIALCYIRSCLWYVPTPGAFKQLGNLGVSVWYRFSLWNCLEFGWDIPLRFLIIAMHVFNVLFLRIPVSKVIHIGAVCAAWSFVFLVVLIGRFATQRPELGPYFGISGAWWGDLRCPTRI